MTSSTPARLAALVLALEGVGLFAIAAWELVALVDGDTTSVETSVALLVLTAISAAALVVLAVGVWRGRSWGRSGGIVAQVLLASVAFGSLTGPDARPAVALALAVPAVVGFVLLLLAARAAGRAADDTAPTGDDRP